jgi:hypothetical protein
MVGNSFVVTIDPTLVKDLKIDDMTFFLQWRLEGGIFMEIQRLVTEDKEMKREYSPERFQSRKK